MCFRKNRVKKWKASQPIGYVTALTQLAWEGSGLICQGRIAALVVQLLVIHLIESYFLHPPPHWGGLDLKRDKKAPARAQWSAAERAESPRIGLPGNPPEGRAPGVWLASFEQHSAVHGEVRHIGGAESARGALRCGQRREPQHQRRVARGLVIAGLLFTTAVYCS